jgi:3-methylcrotonyl-CoA carboxylase alpha subunit
VIVAGRSFTANAWMEAEGSLVATLDGLRLRAGVIALGDELRVTVGDRSIQLHLEDPLGAVTETEAGAGTLTAPMPGRLVKLMVTAGARVTRGEPLLVLEAMKMEHTLTAPADGRVATVFHAEGDQVDEGAELISFQTDG